MSDRGPKAGRGWTINEYTPQASPGLSSARTQTCGRDVPVPRPIQRSRLASISAGCVARIDPQRINARLADARWADCFTNPT